MPVVKWNYWKGSSAVAGPLAPLVEFPRHPISRLLMRIEWTCDQNWHVSDEKINPSPLAPV